MPAGGGGHGRIRAIAEAGFHAEAIRLVSLALPPGSWDGRTFSKET
jgi:hypothetical protein